MSGSDSITCPLCGGKLVYWKEYIVTKTQSISKNGLLSNTVKKSQPYEFTDLEGFQCKKCAWVFNTVNDLESCRKYPHLIKWTDEHKNELKSL